MTRRGDPAVIIGDVYKRQKEVFVKAEHMINGFKDYCISHNEVVYDNPSPGNKAGGSTTLEDKSCGCVQKGGTAPIMDVDV